MNTAITTDLGASKRSESQMNEAAQLSQNLEGLSCLEMSCDQYIPEKKPDLGHSPATDKSVALNFLGLDSSSIFMDFIQAPEKYKQKIQSFNQDNLVELSQSLFEMLWPVLEENYRLKNEIKQKNEADKVEILGKLDMAMEKVAQVARRAAIREQKVNEVERKASDLGVALSVCHEKLINLQKVN